MCIALLLGACASGPHRPDTAGSGSIPAVHDRVVAPPPVQASPAARPDAAPSTSTATGEKKSIVSGAGQASEARPSAFAARPATQASEARITGADEQRDAEPVATASDTLAEPGDQAAADVRADLWQRIRNGYALPDLDGELVTKWEQFYASRPAYMQRMTDRGARYLFHIVEEVQRRQMPLDLALLPFIESAFEPNAKSRVRASGLWQFMPATGRDFDLAQNLFRDDRRSVLDSTRAALDYLQFLNRKFGDWHLALAAYNWGQGNVQRAIERAQRAGREAGYLDLPMPAETRNYVPKLQAIKNIVLAPQRFGLKLPDLQNHPYFLSVAVHRDIDVALVKRLAGVDEETFEQLNPQLNKPVILAAGTPQLLLPYDNAQRFVGALRAHKGPLASWTAWVAPRTLRPADAAKQVGMSERDLREVNRIPPRMLVPRAAHKTADVPERLADNAQLAFAPEARKKQPAAKRRGKRAEAPASAKAPAMAPTRAAGAKQNARTQARNARPASTTASRSATAPKPRAATAQPR